MTQLFHYLLDYVSSGHSITSDKRHKERRRQYSPTLSRIKPKPPRGMCMCALCRLIVIFCGLGSAAAAVERNTKDLVSNVLQYQLNL